MRVIISGIPGAGKTAVLNEALKDKKREVINFGDVMFKMAVKQGITSRDDMRNLSHTMQKTLQITAAKEIAKKEEVIIDTHCTIRTPDGYLPGLPRVILEILQPDKIILIEADPKEIILRRKKDEDIRQRDTETIDDMNLHQQMNRIAAMSYATLIHSSVKIIQNRQGHIIASAKKIADVLG